MLDPLEAVAIAEQFGVADAQVRRDHLLSHLLAALAEGLGEQVVFFGGTALARTHLPAGRLSEDLDLLAVPPRSGVVAEVEKVLARGARRVYGALRWDPPLSEVRDVQPAVLHSEDGLTTVRVQLLDPDGYPAWPTEHRPLIQRYSDVRGAALRVPTLPAFAAAKTAAWHDRHAPRDLYDLWGLARLGALDARAAALFARLGPTGQPPRPHMFGLAPAAASWRLQLAGQTRVAVSGQEALEVVRAAWEDAGGPGANAGGRARTPGVVRQQ